MILQEPQKRCLSFRTGLFLRGSDQCDGTLLPHSVIMVGSVCRRRCQIRSPFLSCSGSFAVGVGWLIMYAICLLLFILILVPGECKTLDVDDRHGLS